MEDTEDISSLIPYEPTDEELANGEPDNFVKWKYFPWTSFEAFENYCTKQRKIIPSIDKVINTLKDTIFTEYDSVAKTSGFLIINNNMPDMPFGIYKSQAYSISFTDDISVTSDDESLELGNDKRARWIYGLDILHSLDNPSPVLSIPIFPIGSLVFTNPSSRDDDTGFRLFINAIDSSVWMIFEYKRVTWIGNEIVITEGDEWGKLAPDDIPFTAAKIANSILDSGIGKTDWPIQIPDDTIRGGPGTVRVYEVDDDFLQRTIPAPLSACNPRKVYKKVYLDSSVLKDKLVG